MLAMRAIFMSKSFEIVLKQGTSVLALLKEEGCKQVSTL